MDELGGSSLFVRELALGLAKRGHSPAVYSPSVGPMARQLSGAGIPVAQRIRELAAFEPDVIHAQHHLEALTALLRFPDTPAVYLSHGAAPSQEHPLDFPRVLQHVAVSQTARERAAEALGCAPDKIELFPSWVDLDRFTRRGPLPSKPRRALMLGNNFTESNGLETLRKACRQCAVELDARGAGVGDPVERPEAILPDYDILFGLGRAAAEGAAVGLGVILCHPDGIGPFLTAENVDPLRAYNFGTGAIEERLGAEAIVRRIRAFEAEQAVCASQRIRAVASLDSGVERLIGIYQEVLDEFAERERPDASQELSAVGDFLAGPGAELLLHRDDSSSETWRAWALENKLRELARRLQEMEGSLTWRMGRMLARIPLLGLLARRS